MTVSDSQITKKDKDWLYPLMIPAIKEKIAANSIILVSLTTLLNL